MLKSLEEPKHPFNPTARITYPSRFRTKSFTIRSAEERMEELTEVVCDAAKKLKKNWQSCSPSLAIICGSGWGSIADVFVQKNFMGYSEIPGMSKTTVAGHAGKLFLCGFQNSEF